MTYISRFIERVRKIIRPPEFPDDRQKNLTARLFNFVILIRFVNTLIFTLGTLAVAQGRSRILIANLSLVALLVITRAIMRTGRLREAAFVHLTTTLLGAVLTVYFIGVGVITPTFILILTIIVIQAGLLLDLRYMIIYGLTAFFALVGLGTMEINGILPPSNLPADPLALLLPSALLFIEISSMIWLALSGMQTAIRLSEQEVKERIKAEKEVRKTNQQLEKRVRERTIQLEEANNDLEAFVYSVSHDLRAPLRAIDGLTQILGDSSEAYSSAEMENYPTLIRKNAVKLSQLIDSLLNFSRLGRTPLSTEKVDPTEIVQEVLEIIQPSAGEELDLVVKPLPRCEADPDLLFTVFLNLLGNALKYSRKSPVSKIEVGSQLIDGETVYYVRDNGIGFNMDFAGKIFGVFQRLHPDDEYEGNGIGLAITSKIIARHNGRIWAEAEEGVGATFYFTIGTEDIESPVD